MLGDAETGTALEKVKARSDPAVLQVGLGVVKQVPAQSQHRDHGDDLEQPRTHTWIVKG
ncbi:hypothetical protein D9M71_376740 [compost metagenome]